MSVVESNIVPGVVVLEEGSGPPKKAPTDVDLEAPVDLVVPPMASDCACPSLSGPVGTAEVTGNLGF